MKQKIFRSVPILVLVFLSIAAGLFAWVGKEKIIRMQFDAKTNEMVHIMNRKFHSSLTFLYAARSFFEAHPEISAQQWRVFVRSQGLESRVKGIKSVEYIIKLESNEKPGFTAKHNISIFPESQGKEDAYVITYVEPFQENQALIGFDLASDKRLRHSIQKAVRLDAAEITAPLGKSKKEKTAESLFQIFLPIYETDHTDVEAPHPPSQVKSLVGISVSDEFFQDLRDYQHLNPGIDFEVYDESLGVNHDGLLYSGGHEPRALNKKIKGRFKNLVALAVPGRSWKVCFSAVDFRAKLRVEMLPFLVFGICLLFGMTILRCYRLQTVTFSRVENIENQENENSNIFFRKVG